MANPGLFARLRHLLFDFSAAQEENQRFLDLVKIALAESRTDTEFESVFKRRAQAAYGELPEQRWDRFRRSLIEYRIIDERVTYRTLAQRFVEQSIGGVRFNVRDNQRAESRDADTQPCDLTSRETEEGVWPPPPTCPPPRKQ